MKFKNKLAEARLLTMQRRPSDPNGLANSQDSSEGSTDQDAEEENNQDNPTTISRPISTASNKSSHGIVRALRSRVQALRTGELLSILFIRTKMPRKARSIYLGTIGNVLLSFLPTRWRSYQNPPNQKITQPNPSS